MAPKVQAVKRIPKKKNYPLEEAILANIEETAWVSLRLSDLVEARGVEPTDTQPAKISLIYNNGLEIAVDMERILNLSFSCINRISQCMIRTNGYTLEAKSEQQISLLAIRQAWTAEGRFLRRIMLPVTGRKIHDEPHWMMEFRDEQGRRRFFRLEDQLKITSNDYLEFLISMLNKDIPEKNLFSKHLEEQIAINNRLRRKIRR